MQKYRNPEWGPTNNIGDLHQRMQQLDWLRLGRDCWVYIFQHLTKESQEVSTYVCRAFHKWIRTLDNNTWKPIRNWYKSALLLNCLKPSADAKKSMSRWHILPAISYRQPKVFEKQEGTITGIPQCTRQKRLAIITRRLTKRHIGARKSHNQKKHKLRPKAPTKHFEAIIDPVLCTGCDKDTCGYSTIIDNCIFCLECADIVWETGQACYVCRMQNCTCIKNPIYVVCQCFDCRVGFSEHDECDDTSTCRCPSCLKLDAIG